MKTYSVHFLIGKKTPEGFMHMAFEQYEDGTVAEIKNTNFTKELTAQEFLDFLKDEYNIALGKRVNAKSINDEFIKGRTCCMISECGNAYTVQLRLEPDIIGLVDENGTPVNEQGDTLQ